MTKSIFRLVAPLALLCLTLGSLPVSAEETGNDSTLTKLTISGQVRFRWFLEDRDPMPRTKSVNYGELRSRVRADIQINPKTIATIELQDSRVMGERINGHLTSGSLRGSNAIDAHQAFITVNHLFADCITLTVGRFEFGIGNERLYGRADWDPVGRAFDGVIVSQTFLGSRFDEIVLKIRDNRIDNGESIYGFRALIPRLRIEPFIMYENDRTPMLLRDRHTWEDYLQRASAGVYHESSFRTVDLSLQAIYQFGRLMPSYFSDKRHIDATLLAGEIGIRPRRDSTLRLAMGIDWATGGRSTSGIGSMIRDFDAPYASYEVSRGGFHLFTDASFPQTHGLSDLYLQATLRPSSACIIDVAAHYFETTEPQYADSGQIVGGSTKVGTELDVNLNWLYESRTHLEFAGSVFSPSEYYSGAPGPSPIFRFYTTLTVDF